MRETLKRKEILRYDKDLARVMARGIRVTGRTLYLRCAQAPEKESSQPSFSLSVDNSRLFEGRRIAFLLARGIKPAVRRNRLKRRLREIYRRHRDWFPEGYDYILHATPAAASMSYTQLLQQIQSLTRRLAVVLGVGHLEGAL